MAIDLGTLSSLGASVRTFSSLILVTPQATKGYQPLPLKEGQPQPPAFLFDYEGEQKGVFESEITDHYVEDNSATQDNIALKPEKIETMGYVGELNDILPSSLAPLKFAAEKLVLVNGLVPEVSLQALIAYNRALAAYRTAESAVNSAVTTVKSLSNLVSGGTAGQNVVGADGISAGGSQNKQQGAFALWYGYWKSRTLFNVQTPWAVFKNVAIERLIISQDEDKQMKSNFEVAFKIIRVAETRIEGGTPYAGLYPQGRAATQSAPLQKMGSQTPSPSSSSSLLSRIA